jgi:TatD DNase family protein
VGFHPQEAGLLTAADLGGLQELAGHQRVVAVGETGFDFYHDNWPHDLQEEVFVRHIELARLSGLPVVIHTRDAAERTLRVLDEHAAGLTVVLHCFSLSAHLAEVLERDYYLSFAGNVTYKSATDLQDACRLAPHDRLLLETDAPYLTPVPFRGRPNRPALVARTYEFVARLRAVTLDDLAEQVEANARRAFPRLGAPARVMPGGV